MLITYIGEAVAGLIGVGIIIVGARFLTAPRPSAAGYGVAVGAVPGPGDAYLAVKGVRDIGSGLILLALLVAGGPHVLGWGMLAAAVMPVGDALIVLRFGGSRGLAYGMHGVTAAVMVVAAAMLLIGR
jgi:hypothetical protein